MKGPLDGNFQHLGLKKEEFELQLYRLEESRGSLTVVFRSIDDCALLGEFFFGRGLGS